MAIDKSKLKGILPPMVTPTDNEGNIDKEKTRNLVNFLIDAGVGGLVPLGGTGEYPALSPKERAMLVETVVDEAAGRVPVVAGVLSPGFKDAVNAGNDFRKAGADAIMLVTPYYVTPTQERMREYFSEFISRVNVAVVIYDIPYRTGVYLESGTINEMVDENDMIIGLKACNTDMAHFGRVMTLVREKISVLSGEDYLFMSHLLMGAKGGILATANVFPLPWIKMLKLMGEGKIEEAKHIHYGMIPFMDAVFSEVNPGPLKEAMALVGNDVGHALRPLGRPAKGNLVKVEEAVQSLLNNPLA